MAEVEITVSCDECGMELRATGARLGRTSIEVTVTQCPNCLDNKYQEGRKDGHAEGIADAERGGEEL